jgi:stress response protein YsnF
VESVDGGEVVVRLSGRAVRLDAALLEERAGDWHLADSATHHLTLVEEHLKVGVAERETGHVRVTTRPESREEQVSVPLEVHNVRVERVPKGVVVEGQEGPRREEGRTIVPVYEEEIVVTKRLVLREEIHLIEEREVAQHEETVTLHRDVADVERLPASPG